MWLEDDVVVDENVITSKAAGTATAFSFAIVDALEGKGFSDKLKAAMYYN